MIGYQTGQDEANPLCPTIKKCSLSHIDQDCSVFIDQDCSVKNSYTQSSFIRGHFMHKPGHRPCSSFPCTLRGPWCPVSRLSSVFSYLFCLLPFSSKSERVRGKKSNIFNNNDSSPDLCPTRCFCLIN